MPLTPPPSAPSAAPASGRARAWAASALWAGLAWLLLAALPVPGTSLLGVPVSLYALIAGWVSAREGRAAGDLVAVRRARWGMALGCAGYVWLGAFFTLAGAAVVAGLLAAMQAAGNKGP
ncbi:MAG: hypothetical protein IT317_01920 [Anaerolineales bacterium]|nr:hypothetical protein [Anaerolineales bacterium]